MVKVGVLGRMEDKNTTGYRRSQLSSSEEFLCVPQIDTFDSRLAIGTNCTRFFWVELLRIRIPLVRFEAAQGAAFIHP